MASLSICYVNSTTSISLSQCDEFQIDASSGSLNLTIPSAIGVDGSHFYIKRMDTVGTSVVSILTQTGQTLDNKTTTNVATLAKYHIMAYNGNWWIIG